MVQTHKFLNIPNHEHVSNAVYDYVVNHTEILQKPVFEINFVTVTKSYVCASGQGEALAAERFFMTGKSNLKTYILKSLILKKPMLKNPRLNKFMFFF